jgi:hypothetical protein
VEVQTDGRIRHVDRAWRAHYIKLLHKNIGPLVSSPGSDPGDALEVFESLAARSKFIE